MIKSLLKYNINFLTFIKNRYFKLLLYTLGIIFLTNKFSYVKNYLYIVYRRYLLNISIIKDKKDDAIETLKNSFFTDTSKYIVDKLDNSKTKNEIIDNLQQLQKITKNKWENGKISGTVYNNANNCELHELVMESYKYFQYSNPLHIDIFPGLQIMESSIVKMCLNLYKAPDNSTGNITSGGTESIFMACKAYRDYAKQENFIDNPEIIISKSTHVAFKKAAHYLNIKIVEIDDHPITHKFNYNILEKYINCNTILVVASAPSFAYGVLDDTDKISNICLKHNISLHLDACLGGFILPFIDNNALFNKYNFNQLGITSISIDTHKYGCAPKGSSLILYRNMSLAHYQYYVDPDWNGGIYISPTLSGSRSGEIIAGTYSTLIYMGINKYAENCKNILDFTRRIYRELINNKNIVIIAEPELSIVSFTTKNFSIYLLCDQMNQKGWSLNCLQFPSACHICITPVHTKEIIDKFISDINESIKYILDNNIEEPKGVYGIYGNSQSIPDRSIIRDIGNMYLDQYYTGK